LLPDRRVNGFDYHCSDSFSLSFFLCSRYFFASFSLSFWGITLMGSKRSDWKQWKKGLEKEGQASEIPTRVVIPRATMPEQKPYEELPMVTKKYPPTINHSKRLRERQAKKGKRNGDTEEG
jgi:hypothetical protein